AVSVQASLLEGVFMSGFSLMAALGGARVEQGRMTMEAYASVLYAFPSLVTVVSGLQGSAGLYRSAGAAGTRLVRLLDTRSTIADGDTPLPRSSVRGEVELVDVSFGYEPGRPVVQGVSVRIPPGGVLGIVGPTGSGKSTLIKLLLRLFDVEAGAIRLDGHDVRTLRLDDLRAAISMVGQEPYLFRGTVRENVAHARAGATDAEIRDALQQAQAMEFVDQLRGGLDADIGERGSLLSGGQRQRLVIARAIVKRAPIMVLDEATSQLDYETEAAIQS